MESLELDNVFTPIFSICFKLLHEMELGKKIKTECNMDLELTSLIN
jgi:hypothetical protein